jgi:nicotinate phosphoribosyltransferase
MCADILSLEGDRVEGETLIQPVMKQGRRLAPPVPLAQSRQRALGELERLPEALRSLARGPEYSVTVSDALRRLAQEVDAMQAQSPTQERSESPLPSPQALIS